MIDDGDRTSAADKKHQDCMTLTTYDDRRLAQMRPNRPVSTNCTQTITQTNAVQRNLCKHDFLFRWLWCDLSGYSLGFMKRVRQTGELCSVTQTPHWNFLTFFPKWLGIFSPNFTRVLHVPAYAGLQFFIQLTATLTKLCHIKRDHHNVLKMSTIDRNARWVVVLNMA